MLLSAARASLRQAAALSPSNKQLNIALRDAEDQLTRAAQVRSRPAAAPRRPQPFQQQHADATLRRVGLQAKATADASRKSAEAQRAAADLEHVAKLRHLSPQCRAEVRTGRPISPPIAAEKREAGRCRVRFYNNTTSTVEIHYISSTSKKLMAKVVAGERFGCYSVAESKFTASNSVTTLASWTTNSEAKQVYFVYDPSSPNGTPGQRKRPNGTSGGRSAFDEDDSDDE